MNIRPSKHHIRDNTKPGLWTLDWTVPGLDSGLNNGLHRILIAKGQKLCAYSGSSPLTSHSKRSTISLHHGRTLYDWDTAFEKQFNWVTICTVHKTKLNKHYTTIHTNWNGTLGHTSSAAVQPPPPPTTEILFQNCLLVIICDCFVHMHTNNKTASQVKPLSRISIEHMHWSVCFVKKLSQKSHAILDYPIWWRRRRKKNEKDIMDVCQLSGMVLSWCFFFTTSHVVGHENTRRWMVCDIVWVSP